jgi:predicted transcriptional regulator
MLGIPTSNARKKTRTLELVKSIRAAKETVERARSMFIKKETVEQQSMPMPRLRPSVLENVAVEASHESKLMVCLKVLCTLVSCGPMSAKQLRTMFVMDESRLKPLLTLLWNRGHIEEEMIGNESRYVVTERGLKILKVISPIIKEAHKIRMQNFEDISVALSGAGYPLDH